MRRTSTVSFSLLRIPMILCLMMNLSVLHANAGQRADSHVSEDGDTNDKGRERECDHLPEVVKQVLAQKIGKRCPRAGSSSGIVKGDFNGDGFADLAIGVPREDTPVGVVDSGAVIVIYGSANGLTTTDPTVPAAQFWSQNSPGMPSEERSQRNDSFGSALAAGDFNGDGFSDLAIGAPGELVLRDGTCLGRGAVFVIYGSPGGLSTNAGAGNPASQLWDISQVCDATIDLCRPGPPRLAGRTDADCAIRRGSFGASLAWGDFDGDGIGDLAIGSPDEALTGDFFSTIANAGAVAVLFGSRNGLSPVDHQLFTLNRNTLPGAQAGDRFGAALAAGDFNGDGASDLVIGIPTRDISGTETQAAAIITNAGAVLVLFGAHNFGLTLGDRQLLDENLLFPRADRAGVASADDLFGSALAVGDFDGDGRDDLAIGAHHRRIGNLDAAGAVFVVYSTPTMPLKGHVQVWDQSRVFPGSNEISELNAVGSPTEAGDHFGWALAAGDFNGDGRDDLAIGVPFETLLVQRSSTVFEHVTNAGEVDVIYGSSPNGLSITGARAPQRFSRNSITATSGDLFGWSLTAWNFGRNETRLVCHGFPLVCSNVPVTTTDLAIGIPGQDVGSVPGAGAVNVFYGSFANNGLTFRNSQEWTHSNTGTGTSQAGEFFGGAVY